MEDILQKRQPYETPEMQLINVSAENCILNVSNYDGAETD
jgi:hypothetical protein